MLGTEDAWFDLSVSPSQPRCIPVTFTPVTPKIAKLQSAIFNEEIPLPSNVDWYKIEDLELQFRSNVNAYQQKSFIIPPNTVPEIRVSACQMYNSPLTVGWHKMNCQLYYCSNVTDLITHLDAGGTPISSDVLHYNIIFPAYYSTVPMLAQSILDRISLLPGGTDAFTFSFSTLNTLTLTWSGPTNGLVLPLGDFDITRYMHSGLTHTKHELIQENWHYYIFGPTPSNPTYSDSVIDTIANKLGMMTDAKSLRSQTTLVILDYPHLNDVNSEVEDINRRHLVIFSRVADGFGDLWGSLSDVFIVSPDVQLVNGQYFPLAKLNLAFSPPYSLAIGGIDTRFVPLRSNGGVPSLTLKILDRKGDNVYITNGYPAADLELRAMSLF